MSNFVVELKKLEVYGKITEEKFDEMEELKYLCSEEVKEGAYDNND